MGWNGTRLDSAQIAQPFLTVHHQFDDSDRVAMVYNVLCISSIPANHSPPLLCPPPSPHQLQIEHLPSRHPFSTSHPPHPTFPSAPFLKFACRPWSALVLPPPTSPTRSPLPPLFSTAGRTHPWSPLGF
jgi:hypothetical protein